MHSGQIECENRASDGETRRGSRTAKYDKGSDFKQQLSIAAAINESPNLYAADGRREPARIVIVGDTDFATNAHIHRGANADFFVNAVDWLAKREELISVRSTPVQENRLNLSSRTQKGIFWILMGFMPGMLGLLGAFVAWRRRR